MKRVVLLHQAFTPRVYLVQSFNVQDVDARAAVEIQTTNWRAEAVIGFVRGMAEMGAIVRTAHYDGVHNPVFVPWDPGAGCLVGLPRIETTIGDEIPVHEQSVHYSLHVLREDAQDSRVEIEVDGPHSAASRNARAAGWLTKECSGHDLIFKASIDPDTLKLTVSHFAPAEIREGIRLQNEAMEAVKSLTTE